MGTSKIGIIMECNSLSHDLPYGEALRSFSRKEMWKPSGSFPVGRGLTKRVMISAQIKFAGRALREVI